VYLTNNRSSLFTSKSNKQKVIPETAFITASIALAQYLYIRRFFRVERVRIHRLEHNVSRIANIFHLN
jgi:hypothetical protein